MSNLYDLLPELRKGYSAKKGNFPGVIISLNRKSSLSKTTFNVNITDKDFVTDTVEEVKEKILSYKSLSENDWCIVDSGVIKLFTFEEMMKCNIPDVVWRRVSWDTLNLPGFFVLLNKENNVPKYIEYDFPSGNYKYISNMPGHKFTRDMLGADWYYIPVNLIDDLLLCKEDLTYIEMTQFMYTLGNNGRIVGKVGDIYFTMTKDDMVKIEKTWSSDIKENYIELSRFLTEFIVPALSKKERFSIYNKTTCKYYDRLEKILMERKNEVTES